MRPSHQRPWGENANLRWVYEALCAYTIALLPDADISNPDVNTYPEVSVQLWYRAELLDQMGTNAFPDQYNNVLNMPYHLNCFAAHCEEACEQAMHAGIEVAELDPDDIAALICHRSA